MREIWKLKSKISASNTPIIWIIFGCLLLVGCGSQSPSELATRKAAENVTLTISVAASLTEAMKAIAPLYQEQNKGVSIDYNFASSGSLQRQIEQGAPVDIFISAASKQMNALQAKELLLEDTRKNLLKNAIVLIVPQTSTAVSNFKDLTSSGVQKMSIGEPESVPAGKYAREVLTSLDLYDRLRSKLVFAKNVRQVLAYVETENVEAGIVYKTDAKLSNNVKIIAVAPETAHSPVVYPVAVIKTSKNPETAREFIEFLSGDAAGIIFENYGFIRLN